MNTIGVGLLRNRNSGKFYTKFFMCIRAKKQVIFGKAARIFASCLGRPPPPPPHAERVFEGWHAGENIRAKDLTPPPPTSEVGPIRLYELTFDK